MKRKILTVVGARPQFIKAAVISRLIEGEYNEHFEEVLVHTGQHYDNNMSAIFFEELKFFFSNQSDYIGFKIWKLFG